MGVSLSAKFPSSRTSRQVELPTINSFARSIGGESLSAVLLFWRKKEGYDAM